MNTQVVVVGAGYAGLACARKLVRSGTKVLVLEARDRVGGRVWSHTLPNGEVIERGAENVMHFFKGMPVLTAKLGLELVSSRASYYHREVREPGAPDAEQLAAAERRLGAHMRQLIASLDAPMSLAEAIASSPLEEFERRFMHARLTTTVGADLADVDLSWLGAYSPHKGPPGSDVPTRIAGGNQRLAEVIAQQLGDAVQLSSPVVALDQTGPRVAATLADGATITADAAVVTAPPPLVREIAFTPALPEAQATAYGAIGFGAACKVGVQLDEPVAPQLLQELPTPFAVYITANSDATDPRALSCLAGGPTVEADLGLADGDASQWLDAFATLMPEVKVSDETVLTRWYADPWTKGSYSYRPLGWTAESEQQLRAMHGQIAFAGEHTAGNLASSLEGALQSGERAAAEVAALLG